MNLNLLSSTKIICATIAPQGIKLAGTVGIEPTKGISPTSFKD